MSQAALTHIYQQCLGLFLSGTAPHYANTLQLSSLEIYNHLPTSTSVIISEPINQSVGFSVALWMSWAGQLKSPSFLAILAQCVANFVDFACASLLFTASRLAGLFMAIYQHNAAVQFAVLLVGAVTYCLSYTFPAKESK